MRTKTLKLAQAYFEKLIGLVDKGAPVTSLSLDYDGKSNRFTLWFKPCVVDDLELNFSSIYFYVPHEEVEFKFKQMRENAEKVLEKLTSESYYTVRAWLKEHDLWDKFLEGVDSQLEKEEDALLASLSIKSADAYYKFASRRDLKLDYFFDHSVDLTEKPIEGTTWGEIIDKMREDLSCLYKE